MRLTLEEISYLGKMLKEKNEIGLFSNINVPLKGDEEKSLIKKGVLDEKGFVIGMDEFLRIISVPERVCRFVAQVGYMVVEKYSYWKDGSTVLAQNSEGVFVFSIDSDLRAVRGQLIDLYGGSDLKTTTISFQMSTDELMTFAALVDLYRKQELLSYLSMGQPKDSFSFQELEQYIQKPMKNGFMSFLQNNFSNFSKTFDLKATISELVKKSVLLDSEELSFNFEPMIFAKNFLLVHSVSLLEVFNLKNSTMAVSSTIFLNAGVHDALRIQLLNKGTDLSTITSRQQIDEIVWALGCPELTAQQD